MMKGKMMKGVFVKTISVLLILFFVNGCVASTKMTINTAMPDGRPVTDAIVMVDGVNIGQTPNAKVKVSNFVGNTPEIIVYKDGYETVKTEAVKEVKAANVVIGIMQNIFSWMFVYGPKPIQTITLTPEQAAQ